MSLQIEPEELAAVKAILAAHLPEHQVWAFGSRVHGENLKPFSDLDLVIIGDQPLPALLLAELKDALSDSALPFKVDVLDWATTNERFRKIIERDHLVIQPGPA